MYSSSCTASCWSCAAGRYPTHCSRSTDRQTNSQETSEKPERFHFICFASTHQDKKKKISKTLFNCLPVPISLSTPLTENGQQPWRVAKCRTTSPSASGEGVQAVNGTVTAGFFSIFRDISHKTITHARHLLHWISTLFVRPMAQQGTDVHLESSESQAGTLATFTQAGAGILSPQGYVCKSH